MPFYVYILKSFSTGKSYIGCTKNLKNRISEHNSNESKATRGKGPWKLVYYEAYNSRSEAIKREKYFKTQIGRLELKKSGIL